jgi:site-specific DNA recombinase
MIPTAQPRTAIYCRVSDPGATEAHGMTTQEAECRAYAERQGWAVTEVYHEWWTGADLFERPELAKARAAMRTKAFDVFLVHRLDRLARDLNGQGFILSECKHHGITWDSATEDVNNPVLVAVVGAMAELDRLKIAANTKRGRDAKIATGVPLGSGSPPYGMAWGDTEKTHFVADPTTAPMLRRMFAAIIGGASIRAVCKMLEADGIPAPRGGRRWDPSTMRLILRSRVYLGEGRWHKTRMVKTSSGKKAHAQRPESEHLALRAGTYPALIDHATFDAVQNLLESHRLDVVAFRTNRNPKVGLLRGGLARCGVCGSFLEVGRNRADTVYRCRQDRKHAGVCTGGGVIPVEVLDEAAWTYLASVLTNPARIRAHLERLRQDDPSTADLAALNRHQADLERQRVSLSAAIAKLADNPYALDELVARLDGVGKQLAATERQRQDILARQAAWKANVAELEDLEARCREVEAAVALATGYDDRRALLHVMRVHADLNPIRAQERWVITSGVVADVATNLRQQCRSINQSDEYFFSDSTDNNMLALPMRWSSSDACEDIVPLAAV